MHESGQAGGNEFLRSCIKFRPYNQCGKTALIDIVEHIDERGFSCFAPKIRETFSVDRAFWSMPMSQAFNNGFDFADQIDVFRAIGLPATDTLFEGKNVILYSLGQTGSGKASTMLCQTRPQVPGGLKKSIDEVGEERLGLLPRVLDEVFRRIDNKADDPKLRGLQFRVELRAMELYNEKIRDGAHFSNKNEFVAVPPETLMHHHVDEDDDNVSGDFMDHVLKKRIAHSAEHAKSILFPFVDFRTHSEVRMSHFHHRTFGVFEIILTQIDGDHGTVVQSKMQLVDSAGSEKIRCSDPTAPENVSLNKSMSTFRRCVDQLIDNNCNIRDSQSISRKAIIPIQDSVLTTVLKNAFYGKAKMFVLGFISPSEINIEDTLNTLRYLLRMSTLVDKITYAKTQKKKAENDQDAENESDTVVVVTRSSIPVAKTWSLEEFFALEEKSKQNNKKKNENISTKVDDE